jgi:hypothetical protein
MIVEDFADIHRRLRTLRDDEIASMTMPEAGCQ